jgi:hypothetical protein
MLVVRTGGVLGVVVALIVAGVVLFVVRPAIDDATDRALDRAGALQTTLADATDTDDYLAAASFGSVVRELKARLGPGAELLDLTVSRQGGGDVKYRTGNRAAGYAWGPGREGLAPVEVTLVGSGRLGDNVFPIAKLSPDASTTLTRAVTAKAGPGFAVETMSLGLAPVSGAVRWTVTGTGEARTLVFTARADGTRVKAVN